MRVFLKLAVLLSLLATAGEGQNSPLLKRSPNPQAERSVSKAPARFDFEVTNKLFTRQLIVKFRPGLSSARKKGFYAQRAGGVRARAVLMPDVEVVDLSPGISVQQAVREYERSPDVLYAEPNYVVQALGDPNDPGFGDQWGLRNIGQQGGKVEADIRALQAWATTTGTSDVVIAFLDSGIDYNHPDLAPNIYRNIAECTPNGVDDDGNGYVDDCYGIDTANNDTDPMDDVGHGTHVAGVAAAAGNNGIGVTGVSWRTRILACKFLSYLGTGTVGTAITCLNYVKKLKDSGVNIIATNNSWGGLEFSQALADAIEAQRQSGILFIAAAGNEFTNNDDVPIYPASYFSPNIIAVAATNRSDEVAFFSNLGRHTVHLGAPGDKILSTFPKNTYGTASGTSSAAPFVAGVAALLAAQDPTRDWRVIKNLLLTGGDEVPDLSETVTGTRLNAYGSMNCSARPLLRRLRPARSTVEVAIGSPLKLAILNVNCAIPQGAMQVAVSNGDVVALVDDGTGGDGVFSANWIPSTYGNYSLPLPTGETIVAQVLENYVPVAVVPEYRTIAGTNLDLDDDSVAKIVSPFPILYGNGRFSEAWVSSNGTVSFTHPFAVYHNRPLPFLPEIYFWLGWDASATTLLAVFWDDLFPVKGTEQNVFWEVRGSAPNRELVIEWRNVRVFECKNDAAQTVKFQVVFYEDRPNVTYQYADLVGCSYHSYGGSASVGLQVAPDKGTSYFYGGGNNAGVTESTAVAWQLASAPVPTNPLPKITKLSPNSVPVNSESSWITVLGTGFTPGTLGLFTDNHFADLAARYVSSTEVSVLVPSWRLSNPGELRMAVRNPSPGGGQSNSMVLGVGQTPAWLGSISPSTATAGGPSFTLTLTGSNLTALKYVFFHGKSCDFVVINDTTATATIPASYITTPGTYQIYVYSPFLSNILEFTVLPAAATPATFSRVDTNSVGIPNLYRYGRFLGWSFAQHAGAEYSKQFSQRAPSGAPTSETMRQLNATFDTGRETEQLVSSPNDGLLGLGIRPSNKVGFIPTSIAMADFNKDGKLDWVVSIGGEDSLWLHRGRGDGTSDPPTIIPLTGAGPIAIVAADLDGDGNQDIIVAEADTWTVGVLRGHGDGTFDLERRYSIPGAPLYLVTGDFNGDNHQDVLAAMAASREYGALALLPGNGTGVLNKAITTPSTDYYASRFYTWVAAGDVDKDGDLDVVAVESSAVYNTSGTFLFLNSGDGTFKLFRKIKDNGIFMQVSAQLADMNEDGCLDILNQEASTELTIYAGDCRGEFAFTGKYFAQGDLVWDFKVVDLDNDGHLDVVGSSFHPGGSPYGQIAGSLLSVMRGDGAGNLSRPRLFRGDVGSYALATGDLNGDGFPDVIKVNQDSDSTSIFLNDGTGSFGGPEGRYVGDISGTTDNLRHLNSPATGLTAIDANGDGRPDLMFLRRSSTGHEIVTVPQEVNHTFGSPIATPFIPLAAPYSFQQYWDHAFGDFRNTGRPDIVAVTGDWRGSHLYYARNNGDGSFAAPREEPYPEFFFATKLATADFDRDGKLDFVIVNARGSNQEMILMRGDGAGNFSKGEAINYHTYQGWPGKVVTGEFTGDGNPDVLVWLTYNVVPETGRDVFLIPGNGDGTFSASRKVMSNSGPILVSDLNHDGLLDIVQFASASGTYPAPPVPNVSVYLCRPGGTFDLAYSYTNFTGYLLDDVRPNGLADYDGDGNVDLAIFQSHQPFGGGSTFVQFLTGHGDGSFSRAGTTELNTPSFPQYAADLDGNGKAEMVELDNYSASFHVIPTVPGPSFKLSLKSTPLLGNQGTLRISLPRSRVNNVQVALTASTPALTIAPIVEIPAGALEAQVPFQLTENFDPYQIASIQGEIEGEAETVQVVKAIRPGIGFVIFANGFQIPVMAGQTTMNYNVGVQSLGGFVGTVSVRCEGLPAGATCDWEKTEVELPQSGYLPIKMFVRTSAITPGGTHVFNLVVTDGVKEYRAFVDLKVIGITLSLIRPKRPGRSQSSTSATISLTSSTLAGSFQVSCRVAGHSCRTSTSSVALTETGSATFEVYFTPQRARRFQTAGAKTIEIEITGDGFSQTFKLSMPN
jgi:hypothetical protein